jgi:hypothetical protein
MIDLSITGEQISTLTYAEDEIELVMPRCLAMVD